MRGPERRTNIIILMDPLGSLRKYAIHILNGIMLNQLSLPQMSLQFWDVDEIPKQVNLHHDRMHVAYYFLFLNKMIRQS